MVILEDSWISLNILEYFWILLSMLKKSRLAARLKLPCGNLDRPKKSRKSCCHSFWCASMLGNVSLPHCHDKDLSFTCLFLQMRSQISPDFSLHIQGTHWCADLTITLGFTTCGSVWFLAGKVGQRWSLSNCASSCAAVESQRNSFAWSPRVQLVLFLSVCGNLVVATGYKWDYTCHKWGEVWLLQRCDWTLPSFLFKEGV